MIVIDFHGTHYDIPQDLAKPCEVLSTQEPGEVFPIAIPHSPELMPLFIEFLQLFAVHGAPEILLPLPFDDTMIQTVPAYTEWLLKVGNGRMVHELRTFASLVCFDFLKQLMALHISRLVGIYTKEYLETTFPPLKINSGPVTQYSMEIHWFDGTPFEAEANRRRDALGKGIHTCAEQDALLLRQ